MKHISKKAIAALVIAVSVIVANIAVVPAALPSLTQAFAEEEVLAPEEAGAENTAQDTADGQEDLSEDQDTGSGEDAPDAALSEENAEEESSEAKENASEMTVTVSSEALMDVANTGMYTAEATLEDDTRPGVYTVQAKVGANKDTATMGIPSVSKQTLTDHPTTESPAIIMGAAVGYEEKIGPVEYFIFKERIAPYSYFRYGIIDETVTDADGNTTTHKKLSGFDGSYYIIRVDVSEIISGIENPDGKYLHVRQDDNKAMMVAMGFDGTTYSNATGSKTGSYSLANNAIALKDTTGNDKEKPYFDVIVLSSGKLAAGADQGSSTAPGADIKLNFYVDDTVDYHPELVALDPGQTYTWPMTVGGVEYADEIAYNNALLTKYFEEGKATPENNASSYTVKGSDLEIDVTVDETDTPEGTPAEFWSLTKATAHQPYDNHTVKLICEVPVLEALSIDGSDPQYSPQNPRSVILDVNSFDIQIANNTTQDQAGLHISKNAKLTIMDGTQTAGAELAVGNNATMIVDKGGVLVIDESCTTEVEFDAATTTGGEPQPTELTVGEIMVKDGGRIINNGVINIEGKEAKPLTPNSQEQSSGEATVTDMRPATMLVEAGGVLENHGCISTKGRLHIMGTLTNDGKYSDMIQTQDPDKGIKYYHKGIQITWKDDVTVSGYETGQLDIGIDGQGNINRNAELNNSGDIVLVPGILNLYGILNNTGNIYLCDVDEAVVPITPTQEAPTVMEKRIKIPLKKSVLHIDSQSTLNVAESSVKAASVHVISNGVLGDMTVLGEPVGDPSDIRADDYVISATDGTRALVQGTDFVLNNGSVYFTDAYTRSFKGTRTVRINIGYRVYTFTVYGMDIPETGDQNQTQLWLFLMIGAFAAAAATGGFMLRRKKSEK